MIARRALSALCLAAGLAAAPASAVADPADAILRPDVVAVIDLTLPQDSIEALEADPDEYQDGTLSLALTDGTPGGVGEASTPIDVGIRLKGQASFRTLAAKAAFKIKLNHSVKGQKLLGLKKLTLNNMVQDPSMLRESLAYEAFRAAGVAAPRTGYAFVRVNGEDYGLYLNVETFDDVSLPAWFDSTAHLYEGSYGSDLTPGGAAAFEVDEGDEDDLGDLEALIAGVNANGGDWSEGLEGVADLEQMTRMWAAERYIGQYDGYVGMPGELWPNNFYLHSDEAGLFSMLPWGADQAWSVPIAFAPDATLMFDRCLADDSCATLYRGAVAAAHDAIAGLDLDAMATATAALLGPWQVLDPRREHSLAEIGEGVSATRAFIAARPGEALAWLSPPQPPAADDPLAGKPEERPARAMTMGRSSVLDGDLLTRLTVSRAGVVAQEVEIRTVKGIVRLCSARVQAKAAGDLLVRCQLSSAARRRLSARWLRLNVLTRHTSPDGASEAVARTLRVRRTAR